MNLKPKNENKCLQALRRFDAYYLLLFAGMGCLFFCLQLLTGDSLFGPTFYNTYTRQAMAWRSGSLHLPQDFPWLELAIYEGEYYVSFPPLPSVVLLPLTFLFGEATPDNLLVKLYGLIACFSIYAALKKAENARPAAALLAFLITAASSALPMMSNGAVWYHAQMLAFALMSLSVMLMVKGMPTGSLFLYALSVACRPFDAMYGPLLYLVYFFLHKGQPFKKSILRLLPGTLLGLCVAAAIGLFNFFRFGNPLEFGHNYLPEFSFQGGIQFSLHHVKNNLKTFLLGSPLSHDGSKFSFNAFGYSLLVACPTVTLMLFHGAADLLSALKQRRFTGENWVKTALFLSMTVHLFLLLLHRTFGGYQLGARYVVDVIPYTVLYFALSREQKERNALFVTLLMAVLLFTFAGVSTVHI